MNSINTVKSEDKGRVTSDKGAALLSLPSKPYHCRKTFATPTLKLINSRLQYYRRVLKQQGKNSQQIQQKYDRDMRVRQLLNRAISHLYER